MTSTASDFLVIGGGIIGVTMSLELAARFPGAKITLVEKESRWGAHASGRNSGVLHAGFYYTADSLKARFTKEGNARLRQYGQERGLQINNCGKLVVARDESDLAGIDELLRRGRANGVDVTQVSAQEAHDLEPLAKTHERALWSPTTSSVDPVEVLQSLARDAQEAGIRIGRGTAYGRRERDGSVLTSEGRVSAKFVVNAAGLQADRVARDFGFSRDYRILPFKGLYLHGSGGLKLRRHVYPVPNLNNPFLGVHFTVALDGHAKIGPTAIPAFWREHYRGLSGFKVTEFSEIMWRELELFARNDFGFRDLAMMELRKYRRSRLVSLAAELVPGATTTEFAQWGQPGVRAQLLNVKTRKLEMDFKYEGDDRSMHILNAVSPAFTSAMPFSAHVVREIASLLGAA